MAVQITLHITFLDGLSFVVMLFAPCQTDLKLGETSLVKIQLERYKGQTPLLEFPGQPADLGFVQQKLPASGRVGRVLPCCRFVRAYVTANQDDLPIPDNAMSLCQIRLTSSNGFHLRARENQTSLIGLQDVIVVTGATVDDAHGRNARCFTVQLQ